MCCPGKSLNASMITGTRATTIPEYTDYDQDLDQDDVDLTFATDMWVIAAERADGLEMKNREMLQLPGGRTLLERSVRSPSRKTLNVCETNQKKKARGVKRERGPRKGWPSPPKCQWEASGAGKDSGRTGTPIEDLSHPPYWNDDPRARWLGPSNVGYAYIDGHRERVLIDSGARANAITPAYCRQNKLKVRPVNELATNPTSIPVSGIGGFTQALGYAIINVRIEGIGSYNEEQVVLVIEDISGLGMRVPVILGMPTIHRLCRQLKESEFERYRMSGSTPYVVTRCASPAQFLVSGTRRNQITLPIPDKTPWTWMNS